MALFTFTLEVITTRWLYCVECPQTVFGLKHSAIGATVLSGRGLMTSRPWEWVWIDSNGVTRAQQ